MSEPLYPALGPAPVWGQQLLYMVSPSHAALRPKPSVSEPCGGPRWMLGKWVPPSQHASRRNGHLSLAFLEERWRRGLSSYTGNHTVVCPFSHCDSHRWGSAHSCTHTNTHTYTNTQTTYPLTTPNTTYSCQRFPSQKSTFLPIVFFFFFL